MLSLLLFTTVEKSPRITPVQDDFAWLIYSNLTIHTNANVFEGLSLKHYLWKKKKQGEIISKEYSSEYF